MNTLRPRSTQFGPEITFGHDLNKILNPDSTTRLAIIKHAVGGTVLATQWYAGGDATTAGDGSVYVDFQNTVATGMAALSARYTNAVIKIEGMIWHQGESDTIYDSRANAYATNLTDFIADIRMTYGTNLPFVVGRLSTNQTANDAARLAVVRQAQTDVARADPYTGLVETDAFALKSDNLHFNADGQQGLGAAFAKSMAYQLWMRGLFTPTQLASGVAEPDKDPDSDGIINQDEFVAGTLPDDATSQLRIELRQSESNRLEISYMSVSNRMFAIESTTNLVDGIWTNLLPAEAGNGTTVIHAITNFTAYGYMRLKATLH